MLRKGLLIMGGALALLAVIGLGVDQQATMLWFVVIAAILSIGGAFVVEDEHALALSRGLGPMVIGIGLVAVFIVGFAAHQPAWAVWLTLLLGLGELSLGGALYVQRQHELHTHAHA